MKRWVLWGAGTLFVLLCGFFVWALTLFRPVAVSDTAAQSFVVTQGDTADVIGQRLRDAGLIRSAAAFSWYVRLQGVATSIQAGNYELTRSMSVGAIVRTVTTGDNADKERTITILEGWTLEDVGAYLEQEGLFSKTEWLTVASVTDSRTILPDRTFERLRDKPSAATLEGYLFPDTYRVFRDAKPADVIGKMLENFEKKITDDVMQRATGQGRTLYSILTMASILEREVRTDTDKKLASDVFWKRLDANIALQSDATVNYVTKKGTTRPSFEDIAIESPYNTYRQPGLPPGPIGNPGLASIMAAIEPEPNDFYYFLTADDGTTIFAKTFEEHIANRQKYLGG